LPAQQPPAQLVESQTHMPPEHRWPAAHAAWPPQVQAPWALQPSAFAPQALHAPPLAPHCCAVTVVTQVPPEQQPVGQLVESHRHWPDTQRWPAAHAGFVPHLHMPVAQLSAVAVHVTHCAPPPPQA